MEEVSIHDDSGHFAGQRQASERPRNAFCLSAGPSTAGEQKPATGGSRGLAVGWLRVVKCTMFIKLCCKDFKEPQAVTDRTAEARRRVEGSPPVSRDVGRTRRLHKTVWASGIWRKPERHVANAEPLTSGEEARSERDVNQ